MVTKHSVIGASSASRWIACPASVRLSTLAPEPVASVYAKEGTLAHEVAESYVLGDNAKIEELKSKPEYKPDMFTHGKAYASFVKTCNRRGKLLVEQSFNLSVYDSRAFGTTDACILDTDSLTVIDYKYGAGVAVEVENNSQLMFYALGALFSLSEEEQDKIERVHMAVFQPRAAHEKGPIRSHTVSKHDLLQWGDLTLEPAMKRTSDPDAPTVSGSHCRWCPAITVCPEQGRLPTRVSAAADFKEPHCSLPEPRQLTPEQIGIALTAREQVEAWFEQIEILARQILDKGDEVYGWKLVQGRKNRAWANEEEAASLLEAVHGSAAYTTKIISPAAASKLGFDVPHLVSETYSNPSLVVSSDKRPSVKSVQLDFKEDQW